MVEIPHIVGHAAILKPNQDTRSPLSNGDGRVANQVSKEEQNKTGCTAVRDLAQTKSANAVRQGEWDSLCDLSLFRASAQSAGCYM